MADAKRKSDSPLYTSAMQELERQSTRMNAASALMEFCKNNGDDAGYQVAQQEFAQACYFVTQYSFIKQEWRA